MERMCSRCETKEALAEHAQARATAGIDNCVPGATGNAYIANSTIYKHARVAHAS